MAKSNDVPAAYTPISMWGYFGYTILFNIPIIGWICIIVFALTAQNINLRNFARSQFCVFIIILVLFGLTAMTGVFSSLLNALI